MLPIGLIITYIQEARRNLYFGNPSKSFWKGERPVYCCNPVYWLLSKAVLCLLVKATSAHTRITLLRPQREKMRNEMDDCSILHTKKRVLLA